MSYPGSSWNATKPIECVFVPVMTSAAGLARIARLAEDLECALVVLGAGYAAKDALADIRWTSERELIAIGSAGATAIDSVKWGTAELLREVGLVPTTTTSDERNTALLLAYLAGWQKIAFVDDNVIVEDADDVRLASGLLDSYDVVGLSFDDPPRRSGFGCSMRSLGFSSEDFPEARAMAVTTRRLRAFFPKISQCDRLYLLNRASIPRIAFAGSAIDDLGDESTGSERPEIEEFGEVIADGLCYLALRGRDLSTADRRYWRRYIDARQAFLSSLLHEFDRGRCPSGLGQDDEGTVRTAQEGLLLVSPEVCENYVHEWQRDRGKWRAYLQQLHAAAPLSRAIPDLGLTTWRLENC